MTASSDETQPPPSGPPAPSARSGESEHPGERNRETRFARLREHRLHLPPGRRSPGGLIWFFFWLIFLPDAVRSAETVGGARGWIAILATLIGLSVFTVGCWYSVAWLRSVGSVPADQIRPWLVVLAAATLVVCWILGAQGLGMLTYLVILVAFAFPWQVTAAVGIPTALLSHFSYRIWPGTPDLQGLTLAVVAGSAGAAVGRVSAQRRHQNELLRKREQELKIADTRNEMARDLHDLLGHSLTAISVKAELAERLIDANPDRARAELADVRSLTRSALAEVRATVNNYREVSLAAEIARAHQMLDAAGIRHELPGAIDAVPEDLRILFAWALREGVTNVVRHSEAQHCRVELSPTSITVIDDGRGVRPVGEAVQDAEEGLRAAAPASSSDSSGGNGLTGLRQRAAEAGAVVRTGPASEGTPARPGFRLVVSRSDAAEAGPSPHTRTPERA